MKINNLLETVLIFIFSILLLNGCRTESNIDENKNIQTNIPQKKLRLKDVPELKNILTSNPKLFNKRVKFSINDSIEVFNINSKKLNSYSVQINPDNDSAFYIVTLSYDKLKNNKVSKLIGKFVPDNNTFEKNIKNFSGKSYFETITGTPIVNSIWKNGKVIDNKNIRNAKTASCTTQSYIVANKCSEDVHWPWEGGCRASGKAYFSISTSMNCDQEMIDPNWGGGGFGDSGGGGSNSIATMSSPDAINYLLAQIGMTSLNTQQYNFLASYPIIADYFKTYFWGDNQNIDGANFMNWGINFFMQNPNTTIEQFQNWFINADGTTRITFDSSVNANNSFVFDNYAELNNFLNNNFKTYSYSSEVMSNDGAQKITRLRVNRMGIYNTGINIEIKLKKQNNLWTFDSLHSEEYIGVGFLYEWAQSTFTNSNNTNPLKIEIFGYEKFGFSISGINIKYKNYAKVNIFVNPNTGEIISASWEDLPG